MGCRYTPIHRRTARSPHGKTMLRSIALIAISLSSTSTLVAQRWVVNPANGHAYALTSKGTWNEAQKEAGRWGANLATVRSATENAWLRKTFSSPTWLWIGLNDEANEGSWVWVSGEKTGYQNWCKGEPNNANGGEDYAHLLDASGCWNDAIKAGQMQGIMELVSPPPKATFSPSGVGCGSAMPPARLASATAPAIGDQFSINLSGMIPGTLGSLVLGHSSTSWGGVPLPLNLSVIGMDGCRLYTSYDDNIAFKTGTGSWTWKVLVPISPAMFGKEFHMQGWFIDAKANRLGVGLTNLGSGRVGL